MPTSKTTTNTTTTASTTPITFSKDRQHGAGYKLIFRGDAFLGRAARVDDEFRAGKTFWHTTLIDGIDVHGDTLAELRANLLKRNPKFAQ